MAEQSFIFIEKVNDPGNAVDKGIDSARQNPDFAGFKNAESVEDMVNQIADSLEAGNCIKSIRLLSHGSVGEASVGNGKLGNDSAKRIGNDNEDEWGPLFTDKLKCKFCPDGEVFFLSCYTGAEKEGLELLEKIKKRLECATVKGRYDTGWPWEIPDNTQKVTPSDKASPPVIPKMPTQAEKAAAEAAGKPLPEPPPSSPWWKRAWDEIRKLLSLLPQDSPELPHGQFLAGFDGNTQVGFKPNAIISGRLLLRGAESPFGPEFVMTHGAAIPGELLRECFKYNVAASLPLRLVSFVGLLQLEIRTADGDTWLRPGALMGGGTLYSPSLEDTCLVYALPPGLPL